MSERLALIHTVTGLIPTFKALCAELMPGLDTFNIVDESLLQNTIREGRLSQTTMRRVAGYIRSAEEAGATGILVTCSSIGPAVDAAQPFAVLPVLRVDEAMVDEAIHAGERVGVLATLQSTLNPTSDLVHRRAAAGGLPIQVTALVCEGAFAAVTAGDTEEHDRLVRNGLLQLSKDADVIILAQASMARIAASLSQADLGVPVLSSPRSGVMRMAGLLGLAVAT